MKAVRPTIALASLLVACGGSGGQEATPIGDGATDATSEASLGDASPDSIASEVGAIDSTPSADAASETASPQGLHVEGNSLVDHGAKIVLHGVNHSGGEYGCVDDSQIMEGPSGDALTAPILAWKATVVRVPVNEQCWLGINGLDPKTSGAAYRAFVTDYVHTLRAAGLYVIFDLHWGAPSTSVPHDQLPMLDADHGPDFWKSVASTFKDDPGVVFDLFNEPFLNSLNAVTDDPWACLLNGCTVRAYTDPDTKNQYPQYESAGTQSLVDAVRSTGAKNVILVPGLQYTNDLSGWLAHAPNDPENQLVASLHIYDFNGCTTGSCWAGYEPIAQQVPLVTGEVGEADCATKFIDGYLPWADARGIGYLGWTWNTWDCSSGPALISAYDGTPTPFGKGFRDHLQSL